MKIYNTLNKRVEEFIPHDEKEVKMYTHIFETITDDNTAYWLGFLTADGSVNTKRL